MRKKLTASRGSKERNWMKSTCNHNSVNWAVIYVSHLTEWDIHRHDCKRAPIAVGTGSICMCLFSGSDSLALAVSEHFCLPVYYCCHMEESKVCSHLQRGQTCTRQNSSSRCTKVLFFWLTSGVPIPKTWSVQCFCSQFILLSKRDTPHFSWVGCMIPPSPLF